jgi:hypothetical protein
MRTATRSTSLACPRCGSESGEQGELGTRICSACVLEFRPRGRVPLRTAARASSEGLAPWLFIAVIVGVVAGVAAFRAPPTPAPPAFAPPSFAPPDIHVALDPIVGLELDSSMDAPSLEPIEQRRTLLDGRVRVTGLIAVPSRPAHAPKVALGFLDAEGHELGRVRAEVACDRIDEVPCPFAFVGQAPPGTHTLALAATGEAGWLGDIDRRTHLRFGFDAAGESTTRDIDSPALADAGARLRLRDDRALVGVGLPPHQQLRDVRATLVGYGEQSIVELVLPLPSPLGLTREVELPTPRPPIVRWQLWVSGAAL